MRTRVLLLIIAVVLISYNGSLHNREINSYKKAVYDAQCETANWELKYKFYATQYEVLNNNYIKAIKEVDVLRTQHQLEAAKQ